MSKTRETEIEYADLIGMPWEDADCRSIALEALDRAGLTVPGRDAWTSPSVEFSEDGLAAYLADWSASWDEIPRAEKLGDVILSTSIEAGARTPHLSVIVDEVRRLAITSSRSMGCLVLGAGLIMHVRSAWRAK